GKTLIAFGICLFYIAMLPWIFVPQAEQLVEYKAYLPSIGVTCLLAGLIGSLPDRTSRFFAAPALTGIVLAFLFITLDRNTRFKDPVRLWQDVITRYPNHYRAHASLGYAYTQRRDYPNAIEAYRRAIRIDPDEPYVHFWLGNTLRWNGHLAES